MVVEGGTGAESAKISKVHMPDRSSTRTTRMQSATLKVQTIEGSGPV